MLLNDCPLENARQRAEHIRKAVRDTTVHFDDIRITISLGVAQHRRDEELASLIHRADSALYEAKRQGRDRVQVAG